ncbi:MAG: hypothetical protein Q8M98_00420 [Candidatus Cloacimonadaceae bacterium]|nr:hypothetical protein [Candidatus Cloacimonadaceae bacterium]
MPMLRSRETYRLRSIGMLRNTFGSGIPHPNIFPHSLRSIGMLRDLLLCITESIRT